MKRLSLLTTALLAIIVVLPVYAGEKHRPAPAAPVDDPVRNSSSNLTMQMVSISAGSFMMGTDNGDSDEKPIHRVTIGYAFEMGKTEVTQGQWKTVMGENPSNFSTCGDDCPVEQVSWDEVQRFIRRLNLKTGKAYRLPSEAEWEYACRAGGNDEYCGGSDVGSMAWFKDNSGEKTMPVAKKNPNAWGLYDMGGNVYEWVQDDYHSNFKGAPADGKAWTGGGKHKVLRGGSWDNMAQKLRAGNRADLNPSRRGAYDGFRLARTL
jgi:formylglycine-generating enzyme required for sulfatase activity